MAELRALLLTDVVDSTKLSEALGDEAMATVWAGHDRIARSLLVTHRGREIDKTDGMLLMFDAAADAVAYAMAYHAGLAAMNPPLKARAGLHVGLVVLRENAPEDVARGAKPLEVDGLAKPIAARVMAVARGGQTLITPEARQALAATALAVHSHGHWMLKGIADPIELLEVAEPGARVVAPPDGDKAYRVVRSGDQWLTLREIPNNLPQQPSRFVGREREVDEVKAHLGQSRLVNVLGMGGLGKTRLTLQVAGEMLPEFPEGVWFLDLAPVRDPERLAAETAEALGVREEPGRPLMQTLADHLRPRRVLVVSDNCEHLDQACAALAYTLLKAAPRLRVLASSRNVLHVPGEQVYPILPLGLPRPGDSAQAVRDAPAVQLFVDRARAHRPGFEVSDADAPAVAELVTRLEGIPLALELAAARLRALSVAEINRRLSDRFKVLTGGAKVLQERQQTLRALVDWSYELLHEAERALFARLAVFIGGFDLAAAEAVCDDALAPADDMLDLVTSLIEKSLVLADEGPTGQPRFRMLDTLRDYAREKLEAGGSAAQWRRRHGEHFFDIARQANQGMRGSERPVWVARLKADNDNLRAAMAWARDEGPDRIVAVKFAVALQGFWVLNGQATEGRSFVDTTLNLPEVQASDIARGHALYVAAALATTQSDHASARELLEQCLALRRPRGQAVEIAATLSTLALSQLKDGDADAARASETEALELFRSQGDRLGEVIGLLHLAQIAFESGDDALALQHAEASLKLARQIEHREIEAECELLLGRACWAAGDGARARAHVERALVVAAQSGDRRVQAQASHALARIDLDENASAAAAPRLRLALQEFREFGMREDLFAALDDHADLAVAHGQAPAAVHLMAAVRSLRHRYGVPLLDRDAPRWRARIEQLRARLVGPDFDAAWQQGDGLELDAVIELAIELATLMPAPGVPAPDSTRSDLPQN